MKNIVMARLAKPCSKRSSAEMLERDFGISIMVEYNCFTGGDDLRFLPMIFSCFSAHKDMGYFS